MGVQTLARFVVVCVLLLLPAAAWAQSSITGVVRDTSGAVLPGVTVEATSPALIAGSSTAVTDSQGLYRIVDLRPGPYTVTFTLPGFTTVIRDGIELRGEFIATVNADMTVGAIEETLTVTGQAPLVDIRSSREQTQFEGETLDALPGTGRLSMLSALLPGANLTVQSQRPGDDRAQTRFSVHGAPEAQPIVDGVNQQIVGCTIGCFVFSQLNIQEVVVESAGGGADRDFGGLQLTMVPRDGGNTFSGQAMFSYTGPDFVSSNITEELLARNLNPDRLGSLKKSRESGAGIGGPIRRDRLWFFAAAREGVTQSYADGVFWNKLTQPASLLYEPDLSRGEVNDDSFTKDYTARFTWQAALEHKFVFALSSQPNCNCRFNLIGAAPRTPEAAGPHQYDPNYGVNITWTHPATNQILLEAGGSAQIQNQNDIREPGWDHTSYRITDQGLNLIYGNVATRTLARRQYHQRFSASYLTGSHQFKTGISFRQIKQGDIKALGHDGDMHGTAVDYRFNNGIPNQLTLLDAPWNYEELATDVALFAQDQWTVRKLTLNVGVRYNDSKASTPEQVLPAGHFVPERRFDATDNVPHYRNLSPRLGVAYDLFGTGRTALKGSLGHYPDIIRGATANPVRNLVRTTNRVWDDRNRNYVPDCDLRNPVANGECAAWSNLAFGRVGGVTRYTDNALSGLNSQYHNWQGSVSLQHEIGPRLGVNVGYFRTWYGGSCGGNGIPGGESCLLVIDNQRVTPADFDQFCITAPSDSRLPGGGGNRLCGLYDVRPALFGQTDNLARPASDFGRERTRVYNGMDATMNLRFGQGGQLSGGVAVGRFATDDCVVFDSPQDGREGFCDVTPPWSAGTQLKMLAVYPLPWDIQTSAIYQNAPGIQILAQQVVTNAAIAPSLGRNLAACGAAAACNANVTIDLIPPQTMFESRQQQLDLRFSRLFRLGSTRRLRGNLDIYNVINASDVLAQSTTYGPTWRNVTSILTGRMLRVSAQFDF
jgi:carboxypeptidase family protein